MNAPPRSTSRLVLALATLSLAGMGLASPGSPSKAASTVVTVGRRCPQFITQDGPDEDTTPDHVPTIPDPESSDCVLTRDVENLLETLELSSGTSLDCRGHKITPASRGISGDPTSRSKPELAVFLHDVTNVQIKNCVIEGFDHGIFAGNNKALTSGPPTSFIVGNTIDARFVALHLTASDRFLVEGNSITWRTRGGAAVFMHFDSDQNVVKDNLIMGDFDATTQGAVLFPGPASPSNPVFLAGHAAVLVVQFLAPHPHLFDAIIRARLFQFADVYSGTPTEGFSADNTIEWNDITFCRQNLTEDGITASNTLRTTVAHNTIGRAISDDCVNGGARIAIRAGSIIASVRYPGRCNTKTDRRCLSDFDCNVPSIDDLSDADTCGPLQTLSATWYPIEFKTVSNTILSPFQVAIGTSGFMPTIEKNSITGPLRQSNQQQPLAVFIIEGKYANDTAIVTQNQVRDASTMLTNPSAPRPAALFYFFRSGPPNAPPADGYLAQISLNNFFSGYKVAILTSEGFNFPAQLSVNGRGNFWGLSCDDAGGFDTTKVVRQDNTLNASVVDSHPYGEALPDLPEDADLDGLPNTCDAP
jgi:parallel beta helix pectate lyase-like protein